MYMDLNGDKDVLSTILSMIAALGSLRRV